jgi:hypothetical protein
MAIPCREEQAGNEAKAKAGSVKAPSRSAKVTAKPAAKRVALKKLPVPVGEAEARSLPSERPLPLQRPALPTCTHHCRICEIQGNHHDHEHKTDWRDRNRDRRRAGQGQGSLREELVGVFGDYAAFAKGNVEAVVESGKILAEGLQDMGTNLVAEGRSAFEIGYVRT